jgi:transcription termination factor Rho
VANGEILGVLDVVGSGAAFVRRRDAGYLPTDLDAYVHPSLLRRFGLRAGDEIVGVVGTANGRGKSPPLTEVVLVNGVEAAALDVRPDFTRLSAQHPNERLVLESRGNGRGRQDLTHRVIDLFCPFGKGQRALIVAPAKAGKTTVLQAVAEGVSTNFPECDLFILLIDERPEEVTEMEAAGFGEVIASSFDQRPQQHVAIAELTLERARRRVEMGRDVVIILDSITRLARAYNAAEAGSGRTLSGGLDANSLEKPKRFLGSARKVSPAQGGGSLTIIATALIDTGSRMDQVIFEEFKGTGNSELVLSRELAERRIFPAIDLVASATRREELLLSADELEAARMLRRSLSGAQPADAMSQLLTILKQAPSNADLVGKILVRD